MSHLQYYAYPGVGETNVQLHGYSQAVRIGDRIECAGQGGWDPATGEFNTEINAQIDQAFKNVDLNLKDAGGKGWSQVYRVYSFHVPINNEALTAMTRNFKKWMPDHKPIWTRRLGGRSLRRAVRSSTRLTDAVREILILRSTYLLDAAYEYKPHVGIAAASGVTPVQIAFTKRDDLPGSTEIAATFPDVHQALAYEFAQQSTVSVKIDNSLSARLQSKFTAAQLVDVFTVVAAYNFTSRIVVGLDIAGASRVKAGNL
ncbi:hypothetical protein MNV49_000761 [Pseudohyphozyma bogoriensis]|nr:hypothetical protein MNV49_000761 [Pseudohyphozyma bogoriensis]